MAVVPDSSALGCVQRCCNSRWWQWWVVGRDAAPGEVSCTILGQPHEIPPRDLLAPPLAEEVPRKQPPLRLVWETTDSAAGTLLFWLSFFLNQSQSPSTGSNDTWQENNYRPNRKVPMPSAPVSSSCPEKLPVSSGEAHRLPSLSLAAWGFAGNKTLQ